MLPDVRNWFYAYRVLMDQPLPNGQNELQYFTQLAPKLQRLYAANFWKFRYLDPTLHQRFLACWKRAQKSFPGSMTFPRQVLLVCGWPQAVYTYEQNDRGAWELTNRFGSDPAAMLRTNTAVVVWAYYREDGAQVTFTWTVASGQWSLGAPVDFLLDEATMQVEPQEQFQTQEDDMIFYYHCLADFAMTAYGWDLWQQIVASNREF